MKVKNVTAESLVGLGLDVAEAGRVVAQLAAIDSSQAMQQVWGEIAESVLNPSHPFAVHQAIHRAVFAEWCRESGPIPAWFPKQIDSTNIGWLMRVAEVDTYEDLHSWTVRRRSDFWDTMIKRVDMRFQKPYGSVLAEDEGPEQPRWLTGAKLNIIDSCFNAPDDSHAMVYQHEGGTPVSVSVAELRSLVMRVANGLIALGLVPGDMIAIDMPMTVEASAVFLGAVAAGCAVVTIADSFAPHEISVRLETAPVRCIFTQDEFARLGKRIQLYEKVKAAGAPKAVVVPFDGRLAEPLRDGDIVFEEFLSGNDDFAPVPRAPSDYTGVLFSSGTTAGPKAIPWDNTTPIKAAIDGHLHHDIHHGDVVCWPTNLGWMMGPWLLYASLINRATVALYYGAPTTPEFCRFVQDAHVTMLGLVPSLVAAWKSSDSTRGLDWSRIRAFSSTGECSSQTDMLYLMSRAGYRPIIEYCGGTEIGGGYITGTVVQPSAAGTFSTAALGSELIILDDDHMPAQMGEVFLVPPSMGLSTELLNRDHHKVYFEGAPAGPNGEHLRRHGDHIQRLPGGYFRAHGRVDDTMNLAGVKVSSLQIEEAVSDIRGIIESAAIAVPPPGGGPSRLIIYVVPSDEMDLTSDDLKDQMQRRIRNNLNPLFRIHDVVIAQALPRTASAKVMRRRLRREYEEEYA